MVNFNLLPENSKTNKIANLSLITILSYSLEEVIPGKSTKYVLNINLNFHVGFFENLSVL